jgi:hypothetical protein
LATSAYAPPTIDLPPRTSLGSYQCRIPGIITSREAVIPAMRSPVTLLTDLEEFIADHRPHGALTADATAPAWNGYLLTVACPCGVVFGRWVTPEELN